MAKTQPPTATITTLRTMTTETEIVIPLGTLRDILRTYFKVPDSASVEFKVTSYEELDDDRACVITHRVVDQQMGV